MDHQLRCDRRKPIAVMKVFYLIAVTIAVLAVAAVETARAAWLVGGLFILQVALLLVGGVTGRELLRPLARLKWLFAILFAIYAFVPGDEERFAADWHAVTVFGCSVWINLGGVALAAFLSVQILTILLAAAVVRLTGPRTDLVIGLRTIGLPKLFVYPLNLILAKLSGLEPPAGGGRRRPAGNAQSPGFLTVLRRLIRGDVAFFTMAIRDALDEARQQLAADTPEPLDPRLANDVAVIAGIGLMMIGFKMLKLLPGVPIASGHKTLLLFPLYLLAARLTYTRWGGTTAGAVMGVVALLQGDGRFGIFEVLKHLAPGLLIDLVMPLVRRLPLRAWVYCGVGLLAGLARLAAELLVLLLLGTRAEVYLLWGVKLFPTLIAGFLSGFVTVAVLRAFPTDRLPDANEWDHATTPTTTEPILIGPPKENP